MYKKTKEQKSVWRSRWLFLNQLNFFEVFVKKFTIQFPVSTPIVIYTHKKNIFYIDDIPTLLLY